MHFSTLHIDLKVEIYLNYLLINLELPAVFMLRIGLTGPLPLELYPNIWKS